VLRALVEVDFDQIIANIFADTVLWSPASEAYDPESIDEVSITLPHPGHSPILGSLAIFPREIWDETKGIFGKVNIGVEDHCWVQTSAISSSSEEELLIPFWEATLSNQKL
jgi:hypothetical protein